jgi:hypothetical protein
MSGFAASGRIERVTPRLARAGADDWPPRPIASPDRERFVMDDVIELVEVRNSESFHERVATLRDRWSELTFFLFDPHSWR